MIRIDHYHHNVSGHEDRLDAIARQLAQLITQGEYIMAALDETRASLATLKTTLVEIAVDMADLVAKAGNATDPAEIAALNASAAEVVAHARQVADVHTPEPPPQVPPAPPA